jgi:4'-phosphopantetheinyl transferase
MRLTVRLCPVERGEREAAHTLLRRTVAAALRVPEPAVAIDREPSGRPYVRGRDDMHVSVSHTPGMAAVAVRGPGPVGVDVEAVRPLPALALSRRWMSTVDSDWLARQPAEHRGNAFLGLWTAKEALGKLYGTGLRDNGMRRPVPVPDRWPGPRGWTGGWHPAPGDPGVAVRYRIDITGFVLAVAITIH